MVDGLQVGDIVRLHLGGVQYMLPRRIVEITYQGVREKDGMAYKGFYTEFGPAAIMSGSVCEGESDYQLLTQDDVTVCRCRPEPEGPAVLCLACLWTLGHSSVSPNEPAFSFPAEWGGAEPDA
jgi:hypothetical protein